jgi:uncharacterized iron-regulated protein
MHKRTQLPVAGLLLFAIGILMAGPVSAQHPASTRSAPVEGTDFRIYERDGDIASFADILAEVDSYDVVLVGEQHDDMVGHGFQASLLGAVFQRVQEDRSVVLSMEMFERDVQYIVDEYLAGLISEDHFLKSSRPWPEYEDRYRPMVEMARAHEFPVVAANAPRRYISRVSAEGPESLSDLPSTAQAFLPPLPYPGPSDEYRAQWDAVMAAATEEMRAQTDSMAAEEEDSQPTHEPAAAEESEAEGEGSAAAPPRHYAPNPNVIFSQALWDAAMGHAITSAVARYPDALVLHMAGSFHVAKGTGIPERIVDYRPGTKVLSIVMEAVDDIDAWDDEEHEGLGDYVILTQKPAETEEVTEGN